MREAPNSWLTLTKLTFVSGAALTARSAVSEHQDRCHTGTYAHSSTIRHGLSFSQSELKPKKSPCLNRPSDTEGRFIACAVNRSVVSGQPAIASRVHVPADIQNHRRQPGRHHRFPGRSPLGSGPRVGVPPRQAPRAPLADQPLPRLLCVPVPSTGPRTHHDHAPLLRACSARRRIIPDCRPRSRCSRAVPPRAPKSITDRVLARSS